MSFIGLKETTPALIPIPPAGKEYYFIDSTDSRFKKKNSSGAVVQVEFAGGGVLSVFGRGGAVISASGDYVAAQITNTPAGNITALTVQDAINELDSEKLTASHKGAGGTAEHPVVTGSEAGFMSPSDKTKLDGVQVGATLNDSDANLKNRANHTGTQAASTISDFSAASDARIAAQKGVANGVGSLDAGAKIPIAQVPDITTSKVTDFNSASDARINAQKGVAGGLVPLDGSVKIPALYLPGFVDDVLEFINLAAFPAVGSSGIIYVAQDTEKIYRWSGSLYLEISPAPGSTDEVIEGAVNLYFTAARAKAAAVQDAIADGVTDVAPSQNAVFDALQLKSNMLSLTGEVTASGTGAVPATLSNSAVINKVLTGFAVDWNTISAADSIVVAIGKLAGRTTLTTNNITQDVTVRSNFTWIRPQRTKFLGTAKITIQSGGRLAFI